MSKRSHDSYSLARARKQSAPSPGRAPDMARGREKPSGHEATIGEHEELVSDVQVTTAMRLREHRDRDPEWPTPRRPAVILESASRGRARATGASAMEGETDEEARNATVSGQAMQRRATLRSARSQPKDSVVALEQDHVVSAAAAAVAARQARTEQATEAPAPTASSLHSKRKQRLEEKTEFRPYAKVMCKAPTGAADLRAAPMLTDFRHIPNDDERRRQHALAMQDWLKRNISKSSIEEETRARTCA